MGAPYESFNLQGATTPTVTFLGNFVGNLGFWFTLSRPMRAVGYRFYARTGDRLVLPCVFWRPADLTLLGIGIPGASQANKLTTADGWRPFFIRPNVHLPAGDEIQFTVGLDGTQWVSSSPGDAILDRTVGPITLLGSNRSGRGGSYYQPGIILSNPALDSSPNLYGVDVLLMDESPRINH